MKVTEGLVKLKVLDSRINKAMELVFVEAAKESDKNIRPSLSKEDYKRKIKADYQSVIDLIKERDRIKSAIVKSNATTMVTVAGVEMTVASAIEKKSSIEYSKDLLLRMEQSYLFANQKVISENERLENKIEKFITTALGKDNNDVSNIKNSISEIADTMRTKDMFVLIDPLNIEKEILRLKTEIEDFESQIDTVLQISNCVTELEI